MPALTRDDILRPPKAEPFPVPEWGGDVYLRPLPGTYAVAGDEDEAPVRTLARYIIGAICDESGDPLFSDQDLPHVEALGVVGLTRVGREIRRRNALSHLDVEAMVGNSSGSPDAGSPSA